MAGQLPHWDTQDRLGRDPDAPHMEGLFTKTQNASGSEIKPACRSVENKCPEASDQVSQFLRAHLTVMKT